MRKKKQTCTCSDTKEHVHTSTSAKFAELGVWLVCLTAVYVVLKQMNIIAFTQETEGLVGLGTIALIGVTASASSCLALVGGLLLSISANWSEEHTELSHWKKFEPLALFNVGRLLGYFIFGGLTAIVGQSIMLSLHATGVMKVILSVVMIILGLNMLHVIPKKYCKIPLPRFVMKKLTRMTESQSFMGAAALGALTYFIPCGFTQSMQLLALGSGSFLKGGLIMLAFSLGTLPALLGISAMSSFVEGRFARFFFTFAGSLSIFLGLLSFNEGIALAGINIRSIIPCCSASSLTNDPNVTIDPNGKQIIGIDVYDSGYSANEFTIQAAKETWIYANAPEGLSGCISQMAIPDFNILKPLAKGENWVGPFTPTKDFQFMCSMGMFRSNVKVTHEKL